MNSEARTSQLRRIKEAENRDPIDNAFLALLALTTEQQCSLFNRYVEHHKNRNYVDGVKLFIVKDD